MIVDIVGNGPSREMFTKSENFAIGCNFARDVSVDATCVIDRHVINKMHNYDYKPAPLIAQKAFKRTIKDYQSQGTPLPIYDLIDRIPGPEYSSGHHAVIYAANQLNATRVNLFGFDSFAKDSVESDTHEIWNNTVVWHRWKDWRNSWTRYFESRKDIQFHIYTLEPITIELPENVFNG